MFFQDFKFFDIQEVGNVLYTLLLTHRESEYSSWSCKAINYFIRHTFQRKHYISIARTGNFIKYALGPFSIPNTYTRDNSISICPHSFVHSHY